MIRSKKCRIHISDVCITEPATNKDVQKLYNLMKRHLSSYQPDCKGNYWIASKIHFRLIAIKPKTTRGCGYAKVTIAEQTIVAKNHPQEIRIKEQLFFTSGKIPDKVAIEEQEALIQPDGIARLPNGREIDMNTLENFEKSIHINATINHDLEFTSV